MKLLINQVVPKYGMTPVPKELKNELKKAKVKLSKDSLFIDLRETPDDELKFAVIDKKNAIMIYYEDGEVFYLEEKTEEETCNGEQGVLIIVPVENNDFIFDILLLSMPPQVFVDVTSNEKFDVLRVFYYDLPPNAYLYPLFYVRKLDEEEKKKWVKKVSEKLEFELTEGYICQAYIALSEEEVMQYINALKKANGIEEKEEE